MIIIEKTVLSSLVRPPTRSLRGCAVAAALALAGLHGTPVSLQAQGLWTFDGRSYYEPLVAGVRDAHVSALALGWADRVDFLVDDQKRRRVWDIDVGTELPILGWESRTSQAGRMPRGGFGLGLWVPIDFHMIEDFVDNSNPIINTDYRFGGMLKLEYGLSAQTWLGMRALVGHESTHLGDEFSLAGQREFPDIYERINVSWEFLDIGLLYEDFSERVWSARVGVTTTLPFQDSYFSVDSMSATQSALGPVTESTNWIDPYAGVDLGWEEVLGSWGAYVSAEARWRSVYDYHKSDPAAGEERALSVNFVAGIRESGTGGALGRASPFVRFYHGVNPHGQFRNQRDFTEFGVGLRLIR